MLRLRQFWPTQAYTIPYPSCILTRDVQSVFLIVLRGHELGFDGKVKVSHGRCKIGEEVKHSVSATIQR